MAAAALTRGVHIAAHGAVWLATLIPAAAIAAMPTVASAVRAELEFQFHAASGSLAEAASIAATNARVLGAVMLAAGAARGGVAVRLLDIVVAMVVLTNAAFVGIALGAYGDRALPWLVHLPLEWAALGIALSIYLAARRRSITPAAFAGVGGAVVGVVAAAAFAETYLTPQH